MSNLPYFKFFPHKWMTGDITFQSYEIQGAFISLCSIYWSRGGNLSLANAKQMLSTCSADVLQTLIASKIISESDGVIIISFLDEQLIERSAISKKRSVAALTKKGAKLPKSKSKAIAKQKQSISSAIKEEEKEEELIYPYPTEKFKSAWNDYTEYRKTQHNFTFKTTKTENIALNGLKDKSKSEADAIAIIMRTIGNGWTGLFETKDSEKLNGQIEPYRKKIKYLS